MVSVIKRLWWGGDPDQVDDVTGLSRRDLHHIHRSWAVIYANQERYGLQLFLRLFRLNPNTKAYFKQIKNLNEDQITKSFQFRAHVINLMSSLNMAVTNLHQPNVVIAMMNKLGETHHKKKVQPVHFDEVKTVLVDILENDLKMDSAVIASWARFVTFIYKYIFETLCDSDD